MTTPQPPIVKWNDPNAVPEVKLGTEKLYWIAIYSEHSKKEHVFTAHYQNRPLIEDEDGELTPECEDWALENDYDGFISCVGWVKDRAHPDYDHFWELIDFSDQYRLLGWAEFEAPVFTE